MYLLRRNLVGHIVLGNKILKKKKNQINNNPINECLKEVITIEFLLLLL